ncbi:hypothetical protein [Niveispirillum sp. BGYR6]|uniref:hypothetical protein n=1 Tax=Niveispirillum sp. BGYR6 TaxID=2971249 RepID=UPI0022B9BFA4|nr:hypothetical protein [Niveispirillum sp. BGYR6]MDG5497979.1 hypothetical protein [Niveispirillum sp. BGYR6]
MARDFTDFAPGEWVEELQPPRRRLQIMAIHARPGIKAANVELAIAGNVVDRLSLSIFALSDANRFRRLR